MTDFRTFFDREYLGAWDLKGRDVTVTIRDVKAGTVSGDAGRKSSKALLYFEKAEKAMVCNITNARTVAAMYGVDTSKWIGKRVTLYATTTQMGPETKDCIRIRPTVPTKKGEGMPEAPVAALAADDPLGDVLDDPKPAEEPS